MKNKLIPPGAGHEVHVWQANLDLPEHAIKQAEVLLCDEEKKRAARFFPLQHRRRFIAAHAALRVILGRYLGLDPANVSIAPGMNGKPGLVAATGHPPIGFNLSHSNDIALIGISEKRAVGIDVEQVRPVSHMDGICRRFFTEPETRMLAFAPEEARGELFFRLWTMKEACLKASGDGLRGLGCLPSVIGGIHDEAPRSDVPEGACLTVSGCSWTIGRIFTEPGYAAAAALEGDEPWDMVYRHAGPLLRY